MILNGTTQYGTIPLQGELNSAELTFHFVLYPDFAADDGAEHIFCAAWNTVWSDLHIYKTAGNSLIVRLNGAGVFSLALGTWQAYWINGGRNVLSISAVSGVNYLWLNGVQIGTTAVAWTPVACSLISIGADTVGSSETPATFSSFYIGHHTSNLAEHTAVYENTMWNWENRCTVNLQMRTSDYEIGNVRTLDSSGNGNHATLGDGSTPATYPTQGAGRMGFDGGDYLDLGNVAQPAGAFTVAIAVNNKSLGDVKILGQHANVAFTDTAWAMQQSDAAGNYSFSVGDIATGVESNPHKDSVAHTIIGTWDGTTAQIYIDGISDKAATVGVPSQPSGVARDMGIGYRAAFQWVGDVFDFKYRDGEAWNATQALDYHSRVMRRLGAEV
jgi:hypothetical protein